MSFNNGMSSGWTRLPISSSVTGASRVKLEDAIELLRPRDFVRVHTPGEAAGWAETLAFREKCLTALASSSSARLRSSMSVSSSVPVDDLARLHRERAERGPETSDTRHRSVASALSNSYGSPDADRVAAKDLDRREEGRQDEPRHLLPQSLNSSGVLPVYSSDWLD